MPTTPVPDLTGTDNAILRAAFWQLYETRAPVPAGAVATAVELDPAAVKHQLDLLDLAGRIRRTDANDVTGAVGLSIEPSRHQLRLGIGTFYTWCALDALGIMVALEATGQVCTTSPHSDAPIEIDFTGGEPTGGALDSVLFLPGYQPGTSVVQAWCPLVNLFEHTDAARTWAADQGLTGKFVPLAQAAPQAGEMWRPRIGPIEAPGRVLDAP